MADWKADLEAVVGPAVARSRSLSEILVDEAALAQTAACYRRNFGEAKALLIADENTWAAAGAAVQDRLQAEGLAFERHVLAAEPKPKASVELAETLRARLAENECIPVMIGSGVLNDLVKYAASKLDRPYFCVATAASMDGYASAGAPLSLRGFKRTISCAPPRAILADLSVIGAAPSEMTGWGYGDLAGKVPAGGDWILADALGVEPLDDVAWPLVQDNLGGWLANPGALPAGEARAVAGLFAGLTVSGLAMEAHGSSRPASGADHQVAHLWEMQGLQHEGRKVSHGACVAVATLAVMRLYDWVLEQDLTALNADAILAKSRDLETKFAWIDEAFDNPDIAEGAKQETAAKHLSLEGHRARLTRVAEVWPDLRRRLRAHMMRADEMRVHLARAGAPSCAGEIGLDAEELCSTVLAARFTRDRYTLLDLLDETGLLADAVGALFSAEQGSCRTRP